MTDLTEQQAIYRRTHRDFKKAFWIQFLALQRSASNFDCGEQWEAVRLANAIYILLGPRRKNHTSLIERIGRKDLSLPSTIPAGASGSQLVCTRFQVVRNITGQNAEYIIYLEPMGAVRRFVSRDLSIDAWWNEIVVRTENCTLSRLTLVRVMRDKDGGAHVDELLNDNNYILASQGSVNMNYQAPDGSLRPLASFLECCMRQIAAEVILGLEATFRCVDWDLNVPET